jgi:hypothetical protein
MFGVTFDTLKLAQRLRDEVKFPPERAEKAASVLADTFADWQAHIDLATRDDIGRLDRRMEHLDRRISESTQRLEERIESRIAEKFAETVRWVVGVGVAQTGLIIAILKLHA